jgi:hypothetical protein
MGNVHAFAAPPVPPPTYAPPIDSNAGEASIDKPTSTSRNPGTIEELHKRCKEVFPNPIEGARLCMNKGLSNHFQVSHTLTMSNMMPPGYKFGATYVGTNIVGPGEAYPVMLGEMDPSGNLSANILHQFHPKMKTKLSTQVQFCFRTSFLAALSDPFSFPTIDRFKTPSVKCCNRRPTSKEIDSLFRVRSPTSIWSTIPAFWWLSTCTT